MKSSRSKLQRDLFNRRHFPLFCLLPPSESPGDPNVRYVHLTRKSLVCWEWVLGANAALGNVVISLFFMLAKIPPMLKHSPDGVHC